MTDVWLDWHSDFQVDSTGDLFLVDGDDETRQRLERRLFTQVDGYIWHPEFGAGLPQKIGETFSVPDITSIVNAQVMLDDTVAPSPPPIIVVAASPNQPDNIGIGIRYTHAQTGITVSLEIAL